MLRTYTLSHQAIQYSLSQLLQRAGVDSDCLESNSALEVSIKYAPSDLTVDFSGIIIVPCTDRAWLDLIQLEVKRIKWLPVEDIMPSSNKVLSGDLIPVLFWGEGYEDGNKPFVQKRDDGTIVFYADIIAATFFMLTCWEEMVISERDEHDRFPAAASVAYRQDFLDRPVIDEYALILREWIRVLCPNWKPIQRKFQIKLSHDIDSVARFPNLNRACRTISGDIFKRHDMHLASKNFHDALVQTIMPDNVTQMQGIYELASISRLNGLKSSFYFMSAGPAPYDNGYSLSVPSVQRCINTLNTQGHEIGFHPGYHTMGNLERLHEEKSRLDEAIGISNYGGRQHYLRFHVPTTWQHWESAGLSYDSTLGYAEVEGFRCGTCHPYQPFDIEQNRILEIEEIPLIVMDVTLKEYRKLTPEQGKDRIMCLVQKCKQVEGVFTLLWHNTSLYNGWEPWQMMYRNIICQLGEMQA